MLKQLLAFKIDNMELILGGNRGTLTTVGHNPSAELEKEEDDP